MTRTEMLAELRSMIDDIESPYWWADATLLRYMAEGQDKFCEDTGYFVDITSNTLTLVASQAVYSIPSRVIQILHIWDGTRRLGKIHTGSELDYSTEWMFEPDTTGTPCFWRTDKETGIITLEPTPTAADAGDTLTLQVWRYSEDDLAGTGAEPEIPSRFHMAPVEWGAYRALNTHDAEKGDPLKARDHMVNFKDYTNDGIKMMRRYHNEETRVGTSLAYRT